MTTSRYESADQTATARAKIAIGDCDRRIMSVSDDHLHRGLIAA